MPRIARQQQDVLKALVGDNVRLRSGLINAQMAAWLLVFGIESAVAALVGADIGDVEWSEDVHGLAKETQGQLACAAGHGLKVRSSRRRKQGKEIGWLQNFLLQHGQHIRFCGACGSLCPAG